MIWSVPRFPSIILPLMISGCLFRKIFSTLNEGGLFVKADQADAATP
jgi:hypothetical protein